MDSSLIRLGQVSGFRFRKCTILLFLLSISFQSFSQNELKTNLPQHSILISAPTPRGLIYHIGYERFKGVSERINYSSSIAGAISPGNRYVKILDWQYALMISPFNLIIGKEKHFFEFSPSAIFHDGYYADPGKTNVVLPRDLVHLRFFDYAIFAGYRYQPFEKNFWFKLGYVAFIENYIYRFDYNHSFELTAGLKLNSLYKLKNKSEELNH